MHRTMTTRFRCPPTCLANSGHPDQMVWRCLRKKTKIVDCHDMSNKIATLSLPLGTKRGVRGAYVESEVNRAYRKCIVESPEHKLKLHAAYARLFRMWSLPHSSYYWNHLEYDHEITEVERVDEVNTGDPWRRTVSLVFQLGHMTQSANQFQCAVLNCATFSMTNMAPSIWVHLENDVRRLLSYLMPGKRHITII